EPIDALGDRGGGDHGRRPELAGSQLVWSARPAQRYQDVEVAVPQSCLREDPPQLDVQDVAEPVQAADQADRGRRQAGALPRPLRQDSVHVIRLHGFTISSREGNISSVETTSWRALALAAFAPAAWGTTYLVTERLLPPDRPLLSATLRALPTGLVLLAATRRLPTGIWWWRATLLGVCNIGMFFPLLFLAAYRLPGGLASTLQATSPLAVMALAAVVIGERAGLARIVAAGVGIVGVALL